MCYFIKKILFIVTMLCSRSFSQNLDYQNCSHGLHDTSFVETVLDSNHSCPPWFVNEMGYCWPGPDLDGIIKQNTLTLQTSLLVCHCMTAEEGALTVGACLSRCAPNVNYYPLPCHVSQLNNFTCGSLHRHGKLCGHCDDGYAIPVYSYDLGCVECQDYKYNWLKYIGVVFLPLTLFYIMVSVFSISFTSPLLSGLVMAFQIIQCHLHHYLLRVGPYLNVVRIWVSITAIWNLDFFRMYYSFCLHPNASPMLILALDYATTVYPIFLITVTYFLVQLYDRNHKIVVWPWKIISAIINPIKRQFNVRTSLVDTFASFLYLSSTRLLITSMNFLTPLTTYTYKEGRLTKTYSLNMFPTVEYFGKEHLPFAGIALMLLLVFLILPMILLFVYPFSCFQRLLNRTKLNFITLHTFVDVFQGKFKDGTNNTKDCRYFSGLIFLIPLIIYVMLMVTRSKVFIFLGCTLFIIYLTLQLMFLPYKHILHNYVSFFMSLFILLYFWAISVDALMTERSGNQEAYIITTGLIGSEFALEAYLYFLCAYCLAKIIMSLYRYCKKCCIK